MRFTAGSVAVTFAFFALFGFIFVVTQYFQFVRGYGTLEAGVRTVPFAVFMASTAPIAAKLAERIGTKLVVTGGLVSMALGFAIATTTQVDTSVRGRRADDVLPRRRARSRPGAGHRGDHGLAAAGEGRCRVGRQRHRPRARRHARRGHHRQRVLVGLRLTARRRPGRDARAGGGRGDRQESVGGANAGRRAGRRDRRAAGPGASSAAPSTAPSSTAGTPARGCRSPSSWSGRSSPGASSRRAPRPAPQPARVHVTGYVAERLMR